VYQLECTVEPIQAGPFEGQIHVFVDDGWLREFILKVSGEAKAADPKPPTPENGTPERTDGAGNTDPH
jgi:hypothetical protein